MQFQLHNHNPTLFFDANAGRGGRCGGYGRGRGRGGGRGGGLRYPRRYNMYCWSHGGCGHLGGCCRDKKDGHKDEATFENKMGGSTANCPPGNVAPAPGWMPPNANA